MAKHEHDNVDHPPHYQFPGGVEVIGITAHLNFCRGNAVKYICRAGKKGGPDKEVEDLKKAKKYIDFELKRLGA